MNEAIVTELKRRQGILKENAKPGEIGTGMSGSRIRFMAALAPIGYPFEPKSWMDAEYVKPIMTLDEFDSDEYDPIFESLFKDAYNTVNKK